MRWYMCFILATGIAACDPAAEPEAAPTTEAAAEPETAAEATPPQEEEEEEEDSSEPSSAGAELPADQELALEDRHPNGTLMRVLGISFEETSIAVEVEAVNGYTEEVQLNARGIWLADDAGNGYNFVEPEQNANLVIAPGGTLTGTLVFFGVLDGDATSLRLLVNAFSADQPINLETRFDRSTDPEFLFDIPLER